MSIRICFRQNPQALQFVNFAVKEEVPNLWVVGWLNIFAIIFYCGFPDITLNSRKLKQGLTRTSLFIRI